MKQKFTSLIIALLFTSAISYAQSLSYVMRDGSAVADNSTVSFNEIAPDGFHLYAAVDLKNSSETDLPFDFMLTVLEKEGVTGVDCCGFGSCVPVSKTFSSSGTALANSTYNFDTYLIPMFLDDPDNFRVKMEFKVSSAKEEHIVYIVLTSDAVGFESVPSQNDIFVSNNGGNMTLNYSFERDARRILNVYNVIGSKVAEMVLPNNATTVQLPSTPQGIYIYSITEEGKTVNSGKYLAR